MKMIFEPQFLLLDIYTREFFGSLMWAESTALLPLVLVLVVLGGGARLITSGVEIPDSIPNWLEVLVLVPFTFVFLLFLYVGLTGVAAAVGAQHVLALPVALLFLGQVLGGLFLVMLLHGSGPWFTIAPSEK